MPQPPSNTSQRLSSRRVDNGVSTLTKMAKGLPAHKEKEEANAGPKQDVAGLEDYVCHHHVMTRIDIELNWGI